MRLFAALLLILSCGWMGLGAARELKRREKSVEALLDSLARLDAGLKGRVPLPELTERLAENSELFAAFSRHFDELGEEPLSVLWERACREGGERMGLLPEDREALQALGDSLGSGLEEQSEALKRCCERLEYCRDTSRAAVAERGKLYGALGVSAGLALALMLY